MKASATLKKEEKKRRIRADCGTGWERKKRPQGEQKALDLRYRMRSG